MSEKLGFWTPVIHPSTSFLRQLEEAADSYLYFGNEVASVTSISNENIYVTIEPLKATKLDCKEKALRIASYVTLVIPFIALLFKIYRKSTYTYLIQDPPVKLLPKVKKNEVNMRSKKDSNSSKEAVSDRKPLCKRVQLATGVVKSKTTKINVKKAEVVVVDDKKKVPDLKSSTIRTTVEDLKYKGFLEHCSITACLGCVRNNLFEKDKNSYFFVERRGFPEDKDKSISFTNRKNTPLAIKTDPLKGSGVCFSIHKDNHYVGLFVHFASRKIVYYDSFGGPIDASVQLLIDKVIKTAFSKVGKVSVVNISKQHQTDGYNCGRYVIHFLKEMMRSKDLDATIKTFKTSNIPQKQIEKLSKQWVKEYYAKGE